MTVKPYIEKFVCVLNWSNESCYGEAARIFDYFFLTFHSFPSHVLKLPVNVYNLTWWSKY